VVAPWDSHPNAFAHRLIADGIISALEQERMSLGLDMVAARHP
jgi:hypothetical protein